MTSMSVDTPAAASHSLSKQTVLFLAWLEDRTSASDELPRFDAVDLSASGLESYLAQQEEIPVWWNEARGAMDLSRVQLPGVHLRRARLMGVDLRGANLAGGAMGDIQLSGALLNRANLQGADLLGATLDGSTLEGCDLRDALLEEASLRGVSMRFAHLQGAVLEHARLNGAVLWGASCEGMLCAHADFSQAVLREATLEKIQAEGASFRGADLGNTQLTDANLRGADLRETKLSQTSLRGANLSESKLQELVLYDCDISHVYLADAWMDRTMLRREQLGGAIGEERAGEYAAAVRGYQTLEKNFAQLGDSESASWAYLKRRRMQKLAKRQQAGASARAHQWKSSITNGAGYLSDQLVEWLCDYGESISRVLATMVLVYLGFTLLYGLTDSVLREIETAAGTNRVVTRNFLDLATFSLLAITTCENPVLGLVPGHDRVHLLTATEVLLGIFLTGLLGYVVGNKIRR